MSYFIAGVLTGLIILLYSYLIARFVAKGWKDGSE